jgi:hypothetical protein
MGGGQFVSATIPVCNRSLEFGRRVVTVRFLVLEEPFLDVGVHDADGQLVQKTKDNGRFDWLHRKKDGTFVICSGPTASGQMTINPPECGVHQPGEASEPYIDLVRERNFEAAFMVGEEMKYASGTENMDGLGYGLVLRDIDMEILDREVQMAAAAWAPGCIGVRLIPEVVAIRSPAFILDDGVIDTEEVPVLVESLQQLNLNPVIGEVQEVILGTTFAKAGQPKMKAVGVTYFKNASPVPFILLSSSTERGDYEWVHRGWDPILAHEFGHAFSHDFIDYENYPWMIYPSKPGDCWVGSGSGNGNGTCALLAPGWTYPDGPVSEEIDRFRRLQLETFKVTGNAFFLKGWGEQ